MSRDRCAIRGPGARVVEERWRLWGVLEPYLQGRGLRLDPLMGRVGQRQIADSIGRAIVWEARFLQIDDPGGRLPATLALVTEDVVDTLVEFGGFAPCPGVEGLWRYPMCGASTYYLFEVLRAPRIHQSWLLHRLRVREEILPGLPRGLCRQRIDRISSASA